MEMINLSTLPLITKDCADWCRDMIAGTPRTFNNQWVIFLSIGIFSQLVYYILVRFEDHIEAKDILPVLQNFTFNFSIIMNIMALVWMIWF